MSLLFNPEAEEEELYTAYGFTVYGKINYYHSIFKDEYEKVLISIRIVNAEKDINIPLGNNFIMMTNFNRTVDNFLYWIYTEKLDDFAIENGIYDTLCSCNSIFNYLIDNKKRRENKHEN